jgi:mannose-6-phosphate isomerase-like protein (cupin superfamily)
MPDVTVKSLDELDSYEGRFLYAGKGLGVTAWGMNVVRMPADWDGYPEHDHAKDGQEEAYVLLEGSATLQAGGETWELVPGVMARVGARQKRTIVPGGEGATMLVIGGTPGKAYPQPE